MDTSLEDTLARTEQAIHGIASGQESHGDLLRLVVERQEAIIKLLTPQTKDGPTLDELMGHLIGQLTQLTGYARQIVSALNRMEQNLPGDVARAVEAGAVPQAVGSGAGG